MARDHLTDSLGTPLGRVGRDDTGMPDWQDRLREKRVHYADCARFVPPGGVWDDCDCPAARDLSAALVAASSRRGSSPVDRETPESETSVLRKVLLPLADDTTDDEDPEPVLVAWSVEALSARLAGELIRQGYMIVRAQAHHD